MTQQSEEKTWMFVKRNAVEKKHWDWSVELSELPLNWLYQSCKEGGVYLVCDWLRGLSVGGANCIGEICGLRVMIVTSICRSGVGGGGGGEVRNSVFNQNKSSTGCRSVRYSVVSIAIVIVNVDPL
ncbi:hypothetical protein TNCV_4391961 [Trichonephila clavipes]|nr:hypothetical protein TNCV_4391961 [Trichonephila clavipes]